jgi:hypothetical protein
MDISGDSSMMSEEGESGKPPMPMWSNSGGGGGGPPKPMWGNKKPTSTESGTPPKPMWQQKPPEAEIGCGASQADVGQKEACGDGQ